MKGPSISYLIKRIANADGAFLEPYGVPCTVESIDEVDGAQLAACKPINGDADLLDVRLQADPGSGLLIVPKIGSIVIVQPINELTGYIALFSEVESMKLLDGTFGGLIKIQDLVEKVNNLEDQVNNLLSTLQGISIPLAPSGTYPFAPLFTSFTPLTPTQVADIENDKITHGTS